MLKKERNRAASDIKTGNRETVVSDRSSSSSRELSSRKDGNRGVVQRHSSLTRARSSDENTSTTLEEREQPEARKEEANGKSQRNRPPHSKQMTDDMSQGRREAFEVFRSDYPHNDVIEENKRILKQRYGEAKSLGEQVNSARKTINTLKTQIEQHRIRRSMKVSDDNDDDDVEERLRNSMEEQKTRYREAFTRLRSLKTEIEHLQHLLEKSKVQMQKDFEEWWVAQSSLPGHNQNGKTPHHPPTAWKTPTPPLSPIKPQDSRGRTSSFEGRHRVITDHVRTSDLLGARLQSEARLSSTGSSVASYPSHQDTSIASDRSSRDGSRQKDNFRNGKDAYENAKRLNSSSSSSSALNLTGDSRADEDILAFIRARQTLLDQKGLNEDHGR